MFYSVVIPVYNRPQEVGELLESLSRQTCNRFEILIIEDGSSEPCENVVLKYQKKLDIRYFKKENSGQGFSRNFGFERAKGDYFVVFDSDCLIPEHYFETVTSYLTAQKADCWGGPDRAHPSFTPLQKAINYSMTSFLTTGGIRGKKNHVGDFHPRSFNMGISREVFQKTGGYKITRMGEDIEFSIRINRAGFTSVLIEDAYVYHKRRTNFVQFFRQLHFFGRARINIKRFYPDELKLFHFFPAVFLAGLCASLTLFLVSSGLLLFIYFLYACLLFTHALLQEKNVHVAFLAVAAGFIQLTAYGTGFVREFSYFLTKGKK